MTVRESLLWGVVSGLTFLVLAQGYELIADVRVGFAAKLGVAFLVTVFAAALTHIVASRLLANGSA